MKPQLIATDRLVMAGVQGGRSAVPARRTLRENLVGTWRLVAARQRLSDGSVRPDPEPGAHGIGYIIYDATGFAQPLRSEPWGARAFIVRDLDGNLILFAGRADDR